MKLDPKFNSLPARDKFILKAVMIVHLAIVWAVGIAGSIVILIEAVASSAGISVMPTADARMAYVIWVGLVIYSIRFLNKH